MRPANCCDTAKASLRRRLAAYRNKHFLTIGTGHFADVEEVRAVVGGNEVRGRQSSQRQAGDNVGLDAVRMHDARVDAQHRLPKCAGALNRFPGIVCPPDGRTAKRCEPLLGKRQVVRPRLALEEEERRRCPCLADLKGVEKGNGLRASDPGGTVARKGDCNPACWVPNQIASCRSPRSGRSQ